jgi:hypothetical protein
MVISHDFFKHKKAEKMVKGAINMWMLRACRAIRKVKSLSIDNKNKNRCRYALLYRFSVNESREEHKSMNIIRDVGRRLAKLE